MHTSAESTRHRPACSEPREYLHGHGDIVRLLEWSALSMSVRHARP